MSVSRPKGMALGGMEGYPDHLTWECAEKPLGSFTGRWGADLENSFDIFIPVVIAGDEYIFRSTAADVSGTWVAGLRLPVLTM